MDMNTVIPLAGILLSLITVLITLFSKVSKLEKWRGEIETKVQQNDEDIHRERDKNSERIQNVYSKLDVIQSNINDVKIELAGLKSVVKNGRR